MIAPRRPARVVLREDPEHDPDEDALMEFRLTYAGKLKGSSRRHPRVDHKHEIRRVFHQQLRRLWTLMPQLSGESQAPAARILEGGDDLPHTIQALSARFARCGYNFVPLVTRNLDLLCGLDILFLRPDPPGTLLRSGDIDNRLKTLFDALRLPSDTSELGKYTRPSDNENPFYSLLEDDSLITKVSVETDTLLESVKVGETAFDNNDARVIITVRLRPYELHVGNMKFG